MSIDKYLGDIKKAGVQSYYGCFCYARNIEVSEALTNKTPNSEYIQWITEKHRVFQEKLGHNRVYNSEEQKRFFVWLKEQALSEVKE